MPVPAEHLWGTQTQRSATFFPIGTDRFTRGRPAIRALGVPERCAALATDARWRGMDQGGTEAMPANSG